MKKLLPNLHFAFLLIAFLLIEKNYAQTPTLLFAEKLETNHLHGIWSRATVTDLNGNLYVTGLFHGTVDFDPSSSSETLLTYQGGITNDNSGEADVYIAKYSSSGSLIWVNRLNEPTFVNMNEERANAMIIDGNHLYLTGFTSTRGFFVSKWDINGNEIWTQYFDDTDQNFVSTFAIAKNGSNLLITGTFANTLDFNPSSETNELTGINQDGFLLSLNENGIFQWVKQFRTNGIVFISDIATDSNNNIFLSGVFVGTVDINPNPLIDNFITSQSVSFGAISSSFITKLDSNGNFIWNQHINGNSTTDIFMSFITVDSNNDIINTFSLKGQAILPNNNNINTPNHYTSNIIKFTNNGTTLWNKSFGIPEPVQSTSFPSSFAANVITDDCNTIYLSGEFSGDCNFNTTASDIHSSLNNNREAFVTSFDVNGNYNWTIDIGGSGNVDFVDFAGYLPIALDSDNNIILTGTFRGEMDFDPTIGVQTLTSNSSGSPDNAGIFISKFTNPNTCTLLENSFSKNTYFEIYPNPSKGLFTLKSFWNESEITIFNLMGKKIHSLKVNQLETLIDLQNLEKGIYIIQLEHDNLKTQEKIIIN